VEPTGPAARQNGVRVAMDERQAGAAGAEAAFRAVYTAQFPVLVRLAYATTFSQPAAEDLVQDAFVDLYRHWSGVTDPPAWLRRAVLNRCTSWVRRRQVERKYAPRGGPPAAPAADADAAAVRAALVRLRPRQRAAVFLRYYLDRPEDGIADALGCRPGTVKSLLHRGLAVLREHLDER